MLAPRTVIGAAPGLANLFDHAAAAQAGFAGTVVNPRLDLETPCTAIAMHIIPNAATACSDGIRERFAYRRHQNPVAGAADPVYRPQWRDTCSEQALRGVDIAYPDHQMAIHQGWLDRATAPGQGGVEPVDGEIPGEWLESLRGQQGMPLGQGRGPRLP
ncbi:hypothetical protein SDC9_196828 [bioreactor metagenome]|uniref:Uncharacterized protein n=1 Tax=bioreactor metagenome TaxID=1076179 RepID=A0A645IPN9_9ZZZZ